jgi:pimeloyl-ACP methyl ester carboxylesterase
MAFEVVMPKWGLSMQEGTIVQWLVEEGSTITKDEPLLEVETEKMVSVVEAPASGILGRIVHAAQSTVAVSEVIAWITEPGEEIPAAVAAAPAAAESTAPAPAPAAPASEPSLSPSGIIRAMPAARHLAREQGLDLAAISGSGPGGVITKGDVEGAGGAAPLPIQKVCFFSEGHRLDGLLYSPEGLTAGEKRPAVVLCVGFTYLKSLVMPDIARALNAAGYIALLFDYRGFGDSEGPRHRLIPQEQVNDVRAALTFVAQQPQVDSDKLAVLGVSLGGSNAIVAGALDQRVGAVVAIEAVGDGERWLHGLRRHWEWLEFQERLDQDRLQRVRTGTSTRVDPLDIVVPDPDSRQFLEAVYREYPQMQCELPLETAEALIEFCPEDQVELIAPRPVLFIHGAADRQVAADESVSMFTRADEPRQLEIVPGMGHFDWVLAQSPGFARVMDLTLGFLQEHLPAR